MGAVSVPSLKKEKATIMIKKPNKSIAFAVAKKGAAISSA